MRNRKLHSNHGIVTVFKSTSARAKIYERHFDRHCGNYVVFSVFYILLSVSSVALVFFDAIKTDYQRILLASSL